MQSVLSAEKELIPQPDPPFSPAFPCVPSCRSQSASICISSTVILQPWMLKLHFTPFHILSLFRGFMQFSLILACAGLRFVCLFFNTDSFPDESSSGFPAPPLRCSPTAAAGTGRPTLDLCSHQVFWLLYRMHGPGDATAPKNSGETCNDLR